MNLSIIQSNVNKMMEARGFTFYKTENDVYIYVHNNQKTAIWYYNNDKLNIDAIKDFICILENIRITNGIIIYQDCITSSTKKILEHMYKYKIELFSNSDFRFNITEHYFYCNHRKLDTKEADEIKKSFGTGLPILLKSDPVTRYFNFSKNDIIEISRKNGFAYRIVK